MIMFRVGEKVVHSPEGVCKIEAVCQLEVDKNQKYYYRLKPTKSESETLYIPIEKINLSVRPLKTKKELEKILLIEPEEGLFYYKNPQKRMNIQNQAIREDDADMIIQLIKMYRRKRQKAQISVGDARWLKEAECYLFSEMSEVLEYDYDFLLRCAQYNQKIQCA